MCPIARGLDRVGDRWTLLILRDLHAGPMRFGELLKGLPGLASNLLVTRLDKAQRDGLVRREGQTYHLTELGRRTDGVLWELAQLGILFDPEPELKRPGHLRLAAVTLQNALRKVAPDDMKAVVHFILDHESFTIEATGEAPITVRYGAPEGHGLTGDLVVVTSYELLMATAAGKMSLPRFRRDHVHLEGPPEVAAAFRDLMSVVMLDAFAATLDEEEPPE